MQISLHQQNWQRCISTCPHTHQQIHTPILSSWMASLILVERKKWIIGVNPLFQQLCLKLLREFNHIEVWRCTPNMGQEKSSTQRHTYTSLGHVFIQTVHYNSSVHVFSLRMKELFHILHQINTVELLVKRKTTSLNKPVLILKRN